ncbi:B3/B4 domain-containing protein [Lederbergia panacisoli]|uniref:B3/B4 domain-containing protein n=1 Tax=Lederbergia panacisoli TaxID=1255251 RepID=UPI00214CD0D9|nr:phenylalanine--tRNA ligase beta subunit-related protein [Lederbergia panacisoli]MCR2821129.1 phenylalanine--tRNA ligase beta subunit-related protein [Lederbergia panacisoli]
MEINLDPQLSMALPEFKVGIIHYKNIIVEESPQMLKGRLQLFQESLFFDLEDTNINDYDEIKEWRMIFKRLGKDPNRYRPSAEALYRRVKKQQFLPSMNSAADINNFFSLKYKIPIGIYDTGKIKGDIVLRIGEKAEIYEGLNGRENQLEHLLLSADEEGPFGSPFVDSTRTAVTNNTTNALQIVYLPSTLTANSAKELLTSLSLMFTQINGGEAKTEVKNAAPRSL